MAETQYIFDFMNNHPLCQIATCRDNVPKIRHIHLFWADENGLIFHTAAENELFSEILSNNKVELCFLNIQTFTQVRVSGKAIVAHDAALKEQIIEHPTREYLRRLISLSPHYRDSLIIFKVVECSAHVWSIETHYDNMKKETKKYYYF